MKTCLIEWNGQALAWATATGIQACVDAFLTDRSAAVLPLPDRQAVIDRLWALAQNVTPPGNGGGVNSAELNRWLVLVDKPEAPWFGASTAQEEPGGGA